MYTLKSIAQRGTLFGAVAALVVAAVIPAASVFADELNPLTERSLLLTSSAPGFQDTDGSGNSTASPSADPDNGTYAPAGSGPNGMKTGETFTFRVSSDSSQVGNELKAMTFQYCTKAAGKCQAPGNNAGDSRTPDRKTNAQALTDGDNTSDLDVNYTNPVAATDFEVFVDGAPQSTGWTMETTNTEDQDYAAPVGEGLTGKNNFITLKNTTGIQPAFNAKVQVVFKATETNHITNPGAGSFFVKINTYKDTLATDIIDGGVTVANVMTDSIHITTKVLETMQFSVGTQNRDTTTLVDPVFHGPCDPIMQINGNQLSLGDQNAESSLSTDTTYDVYSYWRLSSNSSGGATVYYSGNTLANTVGDEISPIGATAKASNPGSEQFGLAFVDATDDDAGKFTSFADELAADTDGIFRTPKLYTLDPLAAYANGTGTLVQGGTASFAFVKESNTTPELIAQDNTDVIRCDTAKIRYMANIGADTPAGVYTTKINYLAAPQY